MKLNIHSRNAHLAAGMFLFVVAANACGPFFAPDVFIRANRPDQPAKYVAGHLGILQPSFPRADLFVAYRYFNGGTLDAAEQKAWSPTYDDMEPESEAQWQAQNQAALHPAPTALDTWIKARAAYPDAPGEKVEQLRGITHTFPGGGSYEDSFLNCSDDAFITATNTLADRAQKWGNDSSTFRDWLHGQDIVFTNCHAGNAAPPASPQGSPALLVSDRAYQAAAANFYGMAYDTAREQFATIAADKSSPWQSIAGYLAARALVRQAFFSKQAVAPRENYDPAAMKQAAVQLKSYLASNPPEAYREAAEGLLSLVSIRIDPAQRLPELAHLVAGPAHDIHYAQNFKDLLWRVSLDTPGNLRPQLGGWGNLVPDENHPGQMRPQTQADINKEAHGAYVQTATVRSYAPIIDWAITVQTVDPAAAAHAIEQWRRYRTLPWLVAALMKTDGREPETDNLIKAAAAIPYDSPAWQTVTYHRIRLLLASGHTNEARTLLEPALLQIMQSGDPSSVNAFRGLAMNAAPTLDEFLKYASQTVLLHTSQEYFAVQQCEEVMKDPNRHYNCDAQVDPLQLDQQVVTILNQQAPLKIWLDAAKSPQLAQQLRYAIALQGWTRALLLKDDAAANAFRSVQPQSFQEQAASDSAFAQWLVLARNPGLNPFLNAGVQRAYSYDFVESYRDNWCYNRDADAVAIAPATFLTAGELAAGSKEYNQLKSTTAALIGQNIVDYVSAHPAEPRAAESLYLVLRMVRYGCTEPAEPPARADANNPQPTYTLEQQQLLKLKQQAARLLRERYASSPWTKKAAPFVG